MRVDRLEVSAFGRFQEWHTGAEPLPNLVVVCGPNEAGKSTLFHFLTTILYGFHPASREGNPHAPWNGAIAGGSARLSLDDGTVVEVERQLRSQPSAKVTVSGRTEELRNRSLPWTEHLPLAVYRQVFALTLDELASLDAETWGRIQDRIIGAMGAADLIPTRQLVADLEREAAELWRPNRRGNQIIRGLQESILGLRDRRREARNRDQQLRELVEAAEAARARLEEVREERHLERMAVERALALAPIRAQLRRIEALEEDAGPPELLRDLPQEPGRELDLHQKEIHEAEERSAELRRARVEPEAALRAFAGPEERVLRRADDIEAFLGRAAALAPLRARLASLTREEGDILRRLDAAAGQILRVSWPEAPQDRLGAVTANDIRAVVRRVRAAEDDLRVLEATQARAETSGGRTVPPGLAWAVLILGAALLAWGLTTSSLAGSAVGGALAALGVGMLALQRGGGARQDDPAHAFRTATESKSQARTALAALLEGLPVSDSVLAGAVDAVPDTIERMQDLMRGLEERRAEAAGLEARLGAADAEGESLCTAVDVQGGADAEAAAHQLDRALRNAERLRAAATAAERELRRIDEDLQRAEQTLADLRARSSRLSNRLRDEGDGDPEEGARRLRQRIGARDRAMQLRDELEHAHPDLDEILARIERAEASGEPWTVDDEDLARRKVRVEQLAEEMERLAAQAEALERDAAHAGGMETVDAVDSEGAALQEKESRLLRERDRRWVVARLLREADRRFREEHQPDLIRQAGRYLDGLTAGRYDRIMADETGESSQLQLRGPAAPGGVPLAPPLSTGTLEQAYLALRLAIVDHLDQGTERLPLFVDEVLAHWDDDRRRAGLELLKRVSQQRQIFVFTCHDDVASELASLGAHAVPLPPAT